MKTNRGLLIGTLLAIGLVAGASAQQAKEVSVKNMPPSVVKTVPAAGATDVDPGLKEITVTFSKEMMDGSWSACQISDGTFPESGSGKTRYLSDKRTWVMPVKLQPGRVYVIWLNRGKFQSFRDTQRNSSIPYLLVFETKK